MIDDQSDGGTIDGRNVAVLGDALPAELAGGPGNLALGAAAFADAAAHDYHLVDGSPAVDAGEPIDGVDVDRDGTARPQGGGPDVGAYELCAEACEPAPDGGARADGGGDSGPASTRDSGFGRTGGSAEAEGGCDCRIPGRSRGTGLAWLLLGAAVAAGRRKRRG